MVRAYAAVRIQALPAGYTLVARCSLLTDVHSNSIHGTCRCCSSCSGATHGVCRALRQEVHATTCEVVGRRGFCPRTLANGRSVLGGRNVATLHGKERETLLKWIKCVSVHDFVEYTAEGIFQGSTFRGADLTSVHLKNHVPTEHEVWVSGEIKSLLRTGCVVRWDDVADVEVYPTPHMVLPSGVEPKKPRLIWDARWLNLMCKHLPFTMDRVGNVAQCAWRGAHQFTIHHKPG